MAYWNNIKTQLKPVISVVGEGINTAVPPRDIKDSQSPDLLNVDTHNFPALSVIKSLITVGNSNTNHKKIFTYKGKILCKISENKIYELKNNLWEEKGSFPTTVGHNVSVANFMDNLYFSGEGHKIIKRDADGNFTILENSPINAKGIAIHANRIYVIYDNILHYSGLRQDNNWNTVDESGKIQISTINGEDLVAITMFSNHIVTFSTNGIYELYGTGPINFEPMTVSTDIGCVAPKSIVELKQSLLWLGKDGIYAYNGGTIPKKISWAIDKIFQRINKDHIDKSCAVTDGRRYILTVPVDNSDLPNLTVVYDIETGGWYIREYFPKIIDKINFKDNVYLMGQTDIYTISDNTNTTEEWYWTSKPFSEGDTARRSNWYKLYLIIDLPMGSNLSVYLSKEDTGDNWELLDEIYAKSNLTRYKLLIPLGMAYDVDWVRIKLRGIGPCTVHEIQRYLRTKPW